MDSEIYFYTLHIVNLKGIRLENNPNWESLLLLSFCWFTFAIKNPIILMREMFSQIAISLSAYLAALLADGHS